MTPRTSPCDLATRQGRLRVAEQFYLAATLIEELVGGAPGENIDNAYVTLCVHAGIAASDVVCGARLGKYSTGENHHAAVQLLKTVDKGLGNALDRLLRLKTPAGYQPTSVSQQHIATARRQADMLMTAARDIA